MQYTLYTDLQEESFQKVLEEERLQLQEKLQAALEKERLEQQVKPLPVLV